MSNEENFRHIWGARVSKDSFINEEILKTSIEFLKEKITDSTIEPVQLKEVLDDKYSFPWNVIAGTNYGTHVTCEKGCFAFFYIGAHAITVFKLGI